MGEEACRGCGSWEEQIYWTHFQYTQFFQFLHPGFNHHLALPDQFSKQMKANLPGTVSLKGPSGITWDVELTTIGDTMFFSHGWEGFVRDHSLQEKDLLVFKYNGGSCFEVLMFDGYNFCEKPSSYFVRKHNNREQDGGSQNKLNSKESCFEFSLESGEDVDEDHSPDLLVDDEVDRSMIGRPPWHTNKKSRKENGAMKSLHSSWIKRNKDPSGHNEEIGNKHGCILFTPVVLASPTSNKKSVTEEEKLNALHLAQSAISCKGFTVVMKPSHVRGKFEMCVPSGWITRNIGSLEKKDVILRINDKTWITKFCFHKSGNRGRLSSGWRHFAIDNNLEEFDVCAFEPGTPENGTLVLDVSILRAVAPVTQ